MSYAPPTGAANATWVGATAYAGVYRIGSVRWGVAPPTVYTSGLASQSFGAANIVENRRVFPSPVGPPAMSANALVTFFGEYVPPYGTVAASWLASPAYTPVSNPVVATWSTFAPGEDQTVYAGGFENSGVGAPSVTKQQFLGPSSWASVTYGRASATRFGEYLPPYAEVHADWSGAREYAPPNGHAIGRFAPYIEGTILPMWLYRAHLGVPDVFLFTRYVSVGGGIYEGQAGIPKILNTSFGVDVPGVAPPPDAGVNEHRAVPPPFVDFRVRLAYPTGIAVPVGQVTQFHSLTFDIQYVDLAARGIGSWTPGAVRAEFAQRVIEPPFIASNVFGLPLVARTQIAAPSAWESSSISSNHELDINLQRLLSHSGEADPAGYGVTTLRNEHELVVPLGWVSDEFNFPIAYNLIQYAFVQPFMGTNSDPTQWPNYSPFVENQDRVLGSGPWQSSRFSVIGNIIRNTATPALPEGFDATLWGAGTFVAHRVRTLAVPGWDDFISTRYTVVYNDAAVLAPGGWDSATYGVPPQVLNLNRTVLQVFGPVGGATGTAFVAFGVRTVAPSVFNDVPASFPEIRLNPFPIGPAGIPPDQVGGHTTYEFFTTAAPKSVNVHAVPWVGEPVVVNRNQTVGPVQSDQLTIGVPSVDNFTKYVTASAGQFLVWGAHLIGLRTRIITPAPTSLPVLAVTHQVRNVIPDPPARQLVEPPSVLVGNEDIPGIVPIPALRLGTFFPDGFASQLIGTPSLSRNTIEVPFGTFKYDQLGVPVLLYTRFVSPKSVPWPTGAGGQGSSDMNWRFDQRPRVSPHTIYSPSADAGTTQAWVNNPSSGIPHRIDQRLADSVGQYSFGAGWPWFGRPSISNEDRAIGPVPARGSTMDQYPQYGTPAFTLRRRIVVVAGIRAIRFGQIIFLNVPQYVDLDAELNHAGVPPLNAWGAATVARPVEINRTLPVVGLDTLNVGTAKVELFNRTVSATGIPHRGNPQQGLTSPWGDTLVGFPRTYILSLGVQTLWGGTLVEFKNRPIYPTGFNSSSLEDGNFDDFAFPMRAVRKNPYSQAASIGDGLVFGACVVTSLSRAVYARGVAGYNEGRPTISATAAVAPSGWESLLVGDIDRWEAGKVKPHGDDLSYLGTPRLRHPLTPSGVADSDVGSPRISPILSPIGILNQAFAGPSVTNPAGCTNRVVTPLPVLSTQVVPDPVIS